MPGDLLSAVQANGLKAVNQLLKSGCDPNINAGSCWFMIPFLVAAENDNREILSSLLQHGADINVRGADGLSALHWAARKGNDKLLQFLLAEGALVNSQNSRGETPLHVAISNDRISAVKVLLESNADVNLRDKEGQSARDMAEKYNRGSILVLLDQSAASECNNVEDDCPKVKPRKRDSSTRKHPVSLVVSKSVDENHKLRKTQSRSSLSTFKPTTTTDDSSKNFQQSSSSFAGRKDLPISYCRTAELCTRYIKTLKIPDVYIDSRGTLCYCAECRDGRREDEYYERGIPPVRYSLPVGWFRLGVKVPPRAVGLNAFELYHRAYHGTAEDRVVRILDEGMLLMPGDISMNGEELRERYGHYNKNWKPDGFKTKKIFLSPSIIYCGQETYAPFSRYEDTETDSVYRYQVAFQVLMQPGSYDVSPDTVGLDFRLDPSFSNDELEWSTEMRGSIIIYGLLVKPSTCGGCRVFFYTSPVIVLVKIVLYSR